MVCPECDTPFVRRVWNQIYCSSRCQRRVASRSGDYPRYKMRLKMQLIRAYGSKCACCGERNIWFLNLDHINGRSGIEDLNNYGEYRRLKRLDWPTDNYQLLCYNCNFSKQVYKSCPHTWHD